MGNNSSLNACTGQPTVKYETTRDECNKNSGKGGIEAHANVSKLDFGGKCGGEGQKEANAKSTTTVTVQGSKNDCGKAHCATSASHPNYDPKNDPYLPSYYGYQQGTSKK